MEECLSIGSPLANQLQQLENMIEEGVIRHTRDNYALTKQKSTKITIKLWKKQTRATSEGIPSSIDIEFLELNDNPYIVTIEEIVPLWKKQDNIAVC